MSSISVFFFSSRRRHTRWPRDWSSDVCSSDLSAWSATATGEIDVRPDAPDRRDYCMLIHRHAEVAHARQREPRAVDRWRVHGRGAVQDRGRRSLKASQRGSRARWNTSAATACETRWGLSLRAAGERGDRWPDVVWAGPDRPVPLSATILPWLLLVTPFAASYGRPASTAREARRHDPSGIGAPFMQKQEARHDVRAGFQMGASRFITSYVMRCVLRSVRRSRGHMGGAL